MTTPAGIYNIIADQGATFSRTITWKNSSGQPVNLTGYSARMQVRKTVASGEALVSMTTQNNRITLGGALGTVAISCPASEMDFEAGEWVYDLEVESGAGVVSRLIMGKFLFRGEVTR